MLSEGPAVLILQTTRWDIKKGRWVWSSCSQQPSEDKRLECSVSIASYGGVSALWQICCEMEEKIFAGETKTGVNRLRDSAVVIRIRKVEGGGGGWRGRRRKTGADASGQFFFFSFLLYFLFSMFSWWVFFFRDVKFFTHVQAAVEESHDCWDEEGNGRIQDLGLDMYAQGKKKVSSAFEVFKDIFQTRVCPAVMSCHFDPCVLFVKILLFGLVEYFFNNSIFSPITNQTLFFSQVRFTFTVVSLSSVCGWDFVDWILSRRPPSPHHEDVLWFLSHVLDHVSD